MLYGLCWFLVAFGAALASAVVVAPDVVASAFGPFALGDAPAALGMWGEAGFGLIGAVCTGWGVTMARTVAGATPREAVRAGAATWFVVDSVVSVLVGLPGNVAFNTVFAVAFWWATRPEPAASGVMVAASAASGTAHR